MRLTDEQLAAFREQGFLNVGRVFNEPEQIQILTEFDRLVQAEYQTLGNEAEGTYPYRAMLNFRSKALKGYINHPALLEFVMQILGPDVRFWWDQGINKSPGARSVIPWHQDNGYGGGVAPEYLTAWLALDDSSPENGGLYVIPGSHTNGYIPHEPWGTAQFIIPDQDDAGAIPLDATAGDMLIFSSLLVHQTVGNHTANRQRRAWVMQFARGDACHLETGAPFDDRAWVAQGGEVLREPFSERRFDMHAR